MSYSFNLTAPNKAAAKDAVKAKFDEIVAAQPVHVADRGIAERHTFAVIDVLPDDDHQDVSVHCNGYVSGNWQGDTVTRISGVTASASASLAARKDGAQ